MKNYLIAMLALLSISCHSGKDTANQKQSLHQNWTLTAFKDWDKEYIADKAADLNLENHTVASANMGCNGMSISYTVKNNSTIQFSNEITATHRHCDDMKLEREFGKLISGMTRYQIKGKTLILSNAKHDQMVFESRK